VAYESVIHMGEKQISKRGSGIMNRSCRSLLL
jgi:hypothetical protein